MIKSFKLVTANRDALIHQVDIMLSQNAAVEVNAKPWSDKRSLCQNRLYWMWLNEISDQAIVNDQKHAPDTWHEYFKKYFCPSKMIGMPAGVDAEVKSTKRLDKGEMHHYLIRIEQWAMEKMFTLTIPLNCEYEQLRKEQEK